MKTTTTPAFSNGSEFEFWQTENCEKCIKATFINREKNKFPQFRCVIQEHLGLQSIGYNEISQRSFNAAKDRICPYKKTERKKYHKSSNQLTDYKLFKD